MKKKKRHLQIEKLKKWDYCMLVVFSFIIVLVLIIREVYTRNTKDSQINLIYNVMEQNAENQKRHFEKYIEDKIKLLKAMVTYPDIYEMRVAAQEKFLRGRSDDFGFSHIFIMTMDGNAYYFDEGLVRYQKEEKFFQDIIEQDIFITKPFYTGTEIVIMTASVSIYDKNGEKVGVLCGAIHLKDMQQIIVENEMILNGTSYILDSDGKYVASKNHEDVYNMQSIYDNPNCELSILKEAFKDKEDKSGIIVLDGITYQGYVAYLEDYNWAILQLVPQKEITERFEVVNISQYILSISIIILIGCLVRIIYLWRRSDKKIYTDPLTKCNSRAACVDLLDSLENKKNVQIMIVYMDLNRFKWVNDTYGHDKGDLLLRLFTDVLKQTFGINGFVGRLGGDEFIAVLLDTTEEELEALWKQVEKLLVESSQKLDFPYIMSSSYGFAVREKGENISIHKVLKEADEKMYEYKVKHKQNDR